MMDEETGEFIVQYALVCRPPSMAPPRRDVTCLAVTRCLFLLVHSGDALPCCAISHGMMRGKEVLHVLPSAAQRVVLVAATRARERRAHDFVCEVSCRECLQCRAAKARMPVCCALCAAADSAAGGRRTMMMI